MKLFDKFFEKRVRSIALSTSRRSALVRVGSVLVGSTMVLPVLPFDRTVGSAHAAGKKKAKQDDDSQCDYWRYCALDGFLCSCCGGSTSTCAPGSEPSNVAWIGTCHNPKDGNDYLISYNDCCGASSCGQCYCNRNERERPGYRMGVHNDINWCMSNASNAYSCTLAAIVGVAKP